MFQQKAGGTNFKRCPPALSAALAILACCAGTGACGPSPGNDARAQTKTAIDTRGLDANGLAQTIEVAR
jgi:hypothetical protein